MWRDDPDKDLREKSMKTSDILAARLERSGKLSVVKRWSAPARRQQELALTLPFGERARANARESLLKPISNAGGQRVPVAASASV